MRCLKERESNCFLILSQNKKEKNTNRSKTGKSKTHTVSWRITARMSLCSHLMGVSEPTTPDTAIIIEGNTLLLSAQKKKERERERDAFENQPNPSHQSKVRGRQTERETAYIPKSLRWSTLVADVRKSTSLLQSQRTFGADTLTH